MKGAQTSDDTPPSRKSAVVHSPSAGAKCSLVIGRACTSWKRPAARTHSTSTGKPSCSWTAVAELGELQHGPVVQRRTSPAAGRAASRQRSRTLRASTSTTKRSARAVPETSGVAVAEDRLDHLLGLAAGERVDGEEDACRVRIHLALDDDRHAGRRLGAAERPEVCGDARGEERREATADGGQHLRLSPDAEHGHVLAGEAGVRQVLERTRRANDEHPFRQEVPCHRAQRVGERVRHRGGLDPRPDLIQPALLVGAGGPRGPAAKLV